MNRFDYIRAADLAEAVKARAAEPSARFIAGGTNILDLMKGNIARPSTLIDITRLPLKAITQGGREEVDDGGIVIDDQDVRSSVIV